MVNNEAFSKRLQKVIDFYDLSASSFAENVGVQRSSISHILSGRNNPSLDFILKILKAYPEVELYWLLNGTGEFPLEKEKRTNFNTSLFSNTNENSNPIAQDANANIIVDNVNLKSKEKKIERIVIFYSDGSFSNFEN